MNYVIFDGKKIAPSKIVCVGRNYVEHIKELGNEAPSSVVIFNKPNSAISDSLHFFSEDTRFEGEICFLILNGNIAGIGFGLDLTKANLQNELKQKGLPWERAKGFDGSAVFGEFVKFEGDISSIRFELFINNKLVQFANYDLMIHKPQEIIKSVQDFMSFEDYDIIMSGTPKGVANYVIGDKFEAFIFCNDTLIAKFNKTVI